MIKLLQPPVLALCPWVEAWRSLIGRITKHLDKLFATKVLQRIPILAHVHDVEAHSSMFSVSMFKRRVAVAHKGLAQVVEAMWDVVNIPHNLRFLRMVVGIC